MIFLKEFGRCAATSEKCPNCGQPANTSFSRLVKDSCGHTKCRMCLLYEEHGCKICQTEHCAQRKGVQHYLNAEEPHVTNGELSQDTRKSSSEEIVLPLELVINKDSKSKESHSDSNSAEGGSSSLYESIERFDSNEETYETVTNDTVTNDNSSEAYIPRIESYDVELSIQNHLRNDNNCDNSKNPQNPPHIKNDSSQVKTKVGKEVAEKSKNVKCNRSHITILPGIPERYKCNVCCKIFRNKKGKCYHDACVTGVRPYQCNLCDRSFVKRSHFEYHERVHRGYKPYKCHLCEKAFPQQNKLNRHLLSHSKEKKFICPECNKRYSKRDDLKNHLSIHNSTTIYKCKSCDKSFRILTNLKRHMQTHTSERPHRCDQCNKSFKDRSLLIRHKRTHGKERPFCCAHCNKVFLSKSELRRHLTVHSDEKPFSCEYCQTLFRRKDNLNRHIRHHHTTEDGCEARKNITMPIVEADQAKGGQQGRQRQKSRKAQPKGAAACNANSREQINSRLDPMGNITPVIRATSEVSNAVPVINGPINIRRLEDRTDRKIFTYTEPIPIAEAVVLNCRIEEKLYPQSASSHNHFVRSYLRDRNSKVNSYPNDTRASQDNHNNFAMTASSQTEADLPLRATEHPTADVRRERLPRREEKGGRGEGENEKGDERYREGRRNFEDPSTVSFLESNCVSTIKKHTTQQSEGCSSKNSTNISNLNATNHTTLPKDSQDNRGKKQSDMHWRRRIAETLKPS
ncbi:PREDICTED: zinc finger protein 808-like isoform X1 [Wasmannia auropunctata]|uniref:zinc finger protein 808-like isoform X1 n=1 Tax=Wasmannia auropunctata TaxID=64793 RepID=UPI0005EE014A|nr:PREDICTED: zinc finger protein 808-like isoform X1 [Wasmannia auropunctata]XP_011699388.1 PREDICTED: zinc finger protein 808-like isoform X1 [Wasmannia auropunctata]